MENRVYGKQKPLKGAAR